MYYNLITMTSFEINKTQFLQFLYNHPKYNNSILPLLTLLHNRIIPEEFGENILRQILNDCEIGINLLDNYIACSFTEDNCLSNI